MWAEGVLTSTVTLRGHGLSFCLYSQVRGAGTAPQREENRPSCPHTPPGLPALGLASETLPQGLPCHSPLMLGGRDTGATPGLGHLDSFRISA